MVSREHKRATLHEKLQILRSVTNSHAQSKTSIILDASNCIRELKQKVERLNHDIATVQSSIDDDQLPAVTVENLQEGLLINVNSGKSCPGLLVYILEAFEDLSLNVVEARVSCTDSFHLQAIGENEEADPAIDAHMVKQAVLQAIRNWSENDEQE